MLSPSAASPAVQFPPMLAWSHYLVLLRVAKIEARSFYEIEVAREGWSVRELNRQVAALLFERLAMNKNPEQVLALAQPTRAAPGIDPTPRCRPGPGGALRAARSYAHDP